MSQWAAIRDHAWTRTSEFHPSTRCVGLGTVGDPFPAGGPDENSTQEVLITLTNSGALVDARKTIVEGAVEIVRDAVQLLEKNQIKLSPASRARLVTNLLTVICGDAKVQPTVSISGADEGSGESTELLRGILQRLEKVSISSHGSPSS